MGVKPAEAGEGPPLAGGPRVTGCGQGARPRVAILPGSGASAPGWRVLEPIPAPHPHPPHGPEQNSSAFQWTDNVAGIGSSHGGVELASAAPPHATWGLGRGTGFLGPPTQLPQRGNGPGSCPPAHWPHEGCASVFSSVGCSRRSPPVAGRDGEERGPRCLVAGQGLPRAWRWVPAPGTGSRRVSPTLFLPARLWF